MSLITLTDRISVSVRAKTTSQANDQKKATGKNIANALTSGGDANISDELASQIGNTSKPTVTDENGNQWVSMSDIIAAGKAMKANGAFETKTSYKYGDIEAIRIGDLPYTYLDISGSGIKYHCYGPFGYKTSHGNPAYFGIRTNLSEVDRVARLNVKVGLANYKGTLYILASGGSYPFRNIEVNEIVEGEWVGGSNRLNTGDNPMYLSDSYTVTNIPITDVSDLESFPNTGDISYFGEMTTETTGGSLIDWTKSDAEIEEDIRNLHETWDVTEHPGASGVGVGAGTYILAGPIEFNDADPVG